MRRDMHGEIGDTTTMIAPGACRQRIAAAGHALLRMPPCAIGSIMRLARALRTLIFTRSLFLVLNKIFTIYNDRSSFIAPAFLPSLYRLLRLSSCASNAFERGQSVQVGFSSLLRNILVFIHYAIGVPTSPPPQCRF